MVNDAIAKEEIQDNKKSKKQKLPKEISQEILKKIFRNLLKAVGIMVYFIVLNLAYSNMKQERLVEDIKVFAGAFLIIGLVIIEKAYKEDKGSTAINGIEFLVLSLHSLSIMHVITLLKYDFRFYLLTSSYIIAVYYVFKSIVLYTKGRKQYLNSLSDISEIIKKDEPIKKEAKKRNKDEKVNKLKETKTIKKNTTRSKSKSSEEVTPKKKTTNTKRATKETKTEESKKEQIQTTEKKKRGRPKKEVKKND